MNGLQVSNATYAEVIELIKQTPKACDIRLMVEFAGIIPVQERTGEPIKWIQIDQRHSTQSTDWLIHRPHRRQNGLDTNSSGGSSALSSSDDDGIGSSLYLAANSHSNESSAATTSSAKCSQKLSSGSSSTSGSDESCASSVTTTGPLTGDESGCDLSGCGGGDLLSRVCVPGGKQSREPFGCGVVKGPPDWPGIFVQHVKAGSLAERVGLEPGDQLVRADEHALDDSELAFDDAIALIKQLQAQQDELWLLVRKGAALRHLSASRIRQHQQQRQQRKQSPDDKKDNPISCEDESADSLERPSKAERGSTSSSKEQSGIQLESSSKSAKSKRDSVALLRCDQRSGDATTTTALPPAPPMVLDAVELRRRQSCANNQATTANPPEQRQSIDADDYDQLAHDDDEVTNERNNGHANEQNNALQLQQQQVRYGLKSVRQNSATIRSPVERDESGHGGAEDELDGGFGEQEDRCKVDTGLTARSTMAAALVARRRQQQQQQIHLRQRNEPAPQVTTRVTTVNKSQRDERGCEEDEQEDEAQMVRKRGDTSGATGELAAPPPTKIMIMKAEAKQQVAGNKEENCQVRGSERNYELNAYMQNESHESKSNENSNETTTTTTSSERAQTADKIRIVRQNCKLHHSSMHSLVKTSLLVSEKFPLQQQQQAQAKSHVRSAAQIGCSKKPVSTQPTTCCSSDSSAAKRQLEPEQQLSLASRPAPTRNRKSLLLLQQQRQRFVSMDNLATSGAPSASQQTYWAAAVPRRTPRRLQQAYLQCDTRNFCCSAALDCTQMAATKISCLRSSAQTHSRRPRSVMSHAQPTISSPVASVAAAQNCCASATEATPYAIARPFPAPMCAAPKTVISHRLMGSHPCRCELCMFADSKLHPLAGGCAAGSGSNGKRRLERATMHTMLARNNRTTGNLARLKARSEDKLNLMNINLNYVTNHINAHDNPNRSLYYRTDSPLRSQATMHPICSTKHIHQQRVPTRTATTNTSTCQTCCTCPATPQTATMAAAATTRSNAVYNYATATGLISGASATLASSGANCCAAALLDPMAPPLRPSRSSRFLPVACGCGIDSTSHQLAHLSHPPAPPALHRKINRCDPTYSIQGAVDNDVDVNDDDDDENPSSLYTCACYTGASTDSSGYHSGAIAPVLRNKSCHIRSTALAARGPPVPARAPSVGGVTSVAGSARDPSNGRSVSTFVSRPKQDKQMSGNVARSPMSSQSPSSTGSSSPQSYSPVSVAAATGRSVAVPVSSHRKRLGGGSSLASSVSSPPSSSASSSALSPPLSSSTSCNAQVSSTASSTSSSSSKGAPTKAPPQPPPMPCGAAASDISSLTSSSMEPPGSSSLESAISQSSSANLAPVPMQTSAAASSKLCFVDELKMLARRSKEPQVNPSSRGTSHSATDSATLIKIINANKSAAAVSSNCNCGAAAAAARPEVACKSRHCGGAKSKCGGGNGPAKVKPLSAPVAPSKSDRLRNEEDGKRRQHGK